LVAGGCQQNTHVERIARFQPSDPIKISRTPDVGVYKIKYSTVRDDTLRTLHGSQRMLGKGQPIGFERNDDGELIAVAGDERFPAMLPEGARFCVWYSKQEDTPRAGQHLVDFVDVAVPALVVGAIVVGALAVEAQNNDCDHDSGGHHHHYHHKR
jgi:hypothetical protein